MVLFKLSVLSAWSGRETGRRTGESACWTGYDENMSEKVDLITWWQKWKTSRRKDGKQLLPQEKEMLVSVREGGKELFREVVTIIAKSTICLFGETSLMVRSWLSNGNVHEPDVDDGWGWIWLTTPELLIGHYLGSGKSCPGLCLVRVSLGSSASTRACSGKVGVVTYMLLNSSEPGSEVVSLQMLKTCKIRGEAGRQGET